MLTPPARTFDQEPRYSIVIPAYNEAQRIAPTLDHILAHASKHRWNIEIVVVDDGSSDATAEVVSRYAASSSGVRLIESPVHRGKGHSVRTGVMKSSGDIILITDADLPASMDEAALLVSAIAGGADIAIGSRWLRPELQHVRQSLERRHLGRCFNLFVRLLLGLGFADTQCGFKAFSSRAASLTFRFQNVSGWAFDAELLVIAASLGLVVEEVPVRTRHDARSRLKPLLHGFQMMLDVVQIACRRLGGKYPSPAAPSLQTPTGLARRDYLWPLVMPTPARIGFAMLTLLASSMLMRDIAPVIGSTTPVANSIWPTVQPGLSAPHELQGSAQDTDQSSQAEDSGDLFGD